jgi:hypothetical protein
MYSDEYQLTAMRKYKEVPQWAYLVVFVGSLAIGIGCSVSVHLNITRRETDCLAQYSTKTPLMPAWSIIVFTAISAFLAIFLGFSEHFHISNNNFE